jgi:hypothetical protein
MMKKVSRVLLIAMLALCICHSAYAAGISDAELTALFPAGKVEKNTTLNVTGQGYFGAEIIVRIPYKEKVSGADADYDVDFKIRRQILNFNREQSEAFVVEKLALFANGSYLYDGTPLGFDEVGSTQDVITSTNIVATTTVEKPQKAAVGGGVVWFQRTTHAAAGNQQVYHKCHYAARVGDFVATLDVDVPGSRAQADAWFQKLITAGGRDSQ